MSKKKHKKPAAVAPQPVRRGYDGAATGRRDEGWIRTGTDANAEILGAQKKLRNSARDLVRNNPYIGLGVEEWETSAAPIAARAQVIGGTRAQNQTIDDLWWRWGKTADYNGLTNFDGLQYMVVRAIKESGGVLVRRHLARSGRNLAVPFQLQLLELDFLDDTRDRSLPDGGGYIIGGIEYDADDRRAAYWLHRRHPGTVLPFAMATEPSLRVPASDMLHIFDPLRPGQQLGASALAPILMRARDTDSYEEAELVRKQTEACITAWVEDANPDASEDNTVGASVVDADGRRIETFSPGMVAYNPPGRSVKFNQPTANGGYPEYLRTQHRGYAAGLGVTYEAVTGDYSQVNFSSARMGHNGFKRRVQKLQNKVLIPQMLDRVWEWFIELAQAVGAIPENLSVWSKWTPPRWESIQPEIEAQADLANMRSGATTLPQVIAARGGDFADFVEEVAAANKMLDEAGIILDSDPRHRTKTGNPADTAATADTSPPAGDGARVLSLVDRR